MLVNQLHTQDFEEHHETRKLLTLVIYTLDIDAISMHPVKNFMFVYVTLSSVPNCITNLASFPDLARRAWERLI